MQADADREARQQAAGERCSAWAGRLIVARPRGTDMKNMLRAVAWSLGIPCSPGASRVRDEALNKDAGTAAEGGQAL